MVGVLNVTPDSFSDGGRYARAEDALRRAHVMVEEGASVIDIGGASSRPQGAVYGRGAPLIPAEEEIARISPVITAVAQYLPEALISVDAFRPAVAHAALEAGAHIINDITGLRAFPEMADIAAEARAPLIVMHAVGHPGAMSHEHTYDDVVGEVCASLESSVRVAESAGVRDVVVDPGFGFGKTPRENLQLMGRLDRLGRLGRPIMVGISRKSTVGLVLGRDGAPAPVHERLFGTLGATAVAVMRGARFIRTHDVRPTVEMLKVLEATHRANPSFAP